MGVNLRHQPPATSDAGVSYRIERRRRVTRNLHLELDEAGNLVVVVPQGWPDRRVHRLVRQHRAWVNRFLERARERHLPPLGYHPGSRHWYRGRQLELQGSTKPPGHVHFGQERLEVSNAARNAAERRDWIWAAYRNEAQRLFSVRLAELAAQVPWPASPKLALRRMKRTWGTCSRNGVIRLNTHLVKVPPVLADYVLFHELCHLVEMNHGARFYALMDTVYTDWRQARSTLRGSAHQYLQF